MWILTAAGNSSNIDVFAGQILCHEQFDKFKFTKHSIVRLLSAFFILIFGRFNEHDFAKTNVKNP